MGNSGITKLIVEVDSREGPTYNEEAARSLLYALNMVLVEGRYLSNPSKKQEDDIKELHKKQEDDIKELHLVVHASISDVNAAAIDQFPLSQNPKIGIQLILSGSGGGVSEETIEALASAYDRGIHVFPKDDSIQEKINAKLKQRKKNESQLDMALRKRDCSDGLLDGSFGLKIGQWLGFN